MPPLNYRGRQILYTFEQLYTFLPFILEEYFKVNLILIAGLIGTVVEWIECARSNQIIQVEYTYDNSPCKSVMLEVVNEAVKNVRTSIKQLSLLTYPFFNLE